MDYDDVVEAMAKVRPSRRPVERDRVPGRLIVAAGRCSPARSSRSGGRPPCRRAGGSARPRGTARPGAVVAARAYGVVRAAPVLGGAAALFAFAGGWLAAGTGGATRTMIACAAVMVAVVVAGIGTVRPGPVLVAGGTAALFGLAGGAAAMAVSPGRGRGLRPGRRGAHLRSRPVGGHPDRRPAPPRWPAPSGRRCRTRVIGPRRWGGHRPDIRSGYPDRRRAPRAAGGGRRRGWTGIGSALSSRRLVGPRAVGLVATGLALRARVYAGPRTGPSR